MTSTDELVTTSSLQTQLTTTSSSISPFVPRRNLTRFPLAFSQMYRECCLADPATMYSPSPEKQHFFHKDLDDYDGNEDDDEDDNDDDDDDENQFIMWQHLCNKNLASLVNINHCNYNHHFHHHHHHHHHHHLLLL